MSLQKIFPPLKDSNGQSIPCQCGCRRVSRHIHHIKPRCEGGTDHPNNLLMLCNRCHTAHHSKAGDFKKWGSVGGKSTAQKMVSIPNLVQFKGEAGAKRWELYCQKKANMQVGGFYG